MAPTRFPPRIARALYLVVLSLVACSPLLQDGWFDSHEGACVPERVIALSREIASGSLYPRHLGCGNYGRGSLYFNFYSPGLYLLIAYLYTAGVPLAAAFKGTLVVLFLVSAFGMYLWTARHLGGEGPLVAASLYVLAPYHLFDLYTRGAIAEFAALALLPFLFLGIDRVASESRPRAGSVLLAASTAALVLVHNLTAVMTAPFAAAWLIRASAKGEAPWRAFRRGVGAAALGVGLAAMHWLPALIEARDLLQLRTVVLQGHYFYGDHFVPPLQLLGLGTERINDETTIGVGAAIVILLLLSLPAIWRKRSGVSFAAMSLLLGLAALLLVSRAAILLYQLVPGLPFVQFPWRYLGQATLFLSAAAGSVGESPLFLRGPLRFGLWTVLGLGLVASSHAGRRVTGVIPDLKAREESLLAGGPAGGFCAEAVYLPRWTRVESLHVPITASKTARITDLAVAGSRMTFTAESTEPANDIVLPWFYFPGWKARVDGRPADLDPQGDGLLRLRVGQGRHRVLVWFGTTAVRVFAWALAGMACLGLVWCGAGTPGLRGRSKAPPPLLSRADPTRPPRLRSSRG